MSWHHGTITLNGATVETSWRTRNGVVTGVDVPPGTGLDAVIVIDGVEYAVENMKREDFGDRVTVPLITRAEMDARLKATADALAKAQADFEGKPWPPVTEPVEPEGEPRGKSRAR